MQFVQPNYERVDEADVLSYGSSPVRSEQDVAMKNSTASELDVVFEVTCAKVLQPLKQSIFAACSVVCMGNFWAL